MLSDKKINYGVFYFTNLQNAKLYPNDHLPCHWLLIFKKLILAEKNKPSTQDSKLYAKVDEETINKDCGLGGREHRRAQNEKIWERKRSKREERNTFNDKLSLSP